MQRAGVDAALAGGPCVQEGVGRGPRGQWGKSMPHTPRPRGFTLRLWASGQGVEDAHRGVSEADPAGGRVRQFEGGVCSVSGEAPAGRELGESADGGPEKAERVESTC